MFSQQFDTLKYVQSLDLFKYKYVGISLPKELKQDIIELLPDSIKKNMQAVLLKQSIPQDPSEAWEKGQLDAFGDLSNYKMIIYGWGLGRVVIDSPSGFWSYEEIKKHILKTEYNIEINSKYGCNILNSQKAYIEGYNKVVYDFANQLYGIDLSEMKNDKVKEYILKYGSFHPEWKL